MNEKINKTNRDLAFFKSRLDQVPLSPYERLLAEAHLARAEAMADALAGLVALAGRFLKSLTAYPFRRRTTPVG